MLLLVPSETVDPRRADEHFARESAAARELGVAVCLVDHDALIQLGDASKAIRSVNVESADAIYRGWMVSSRQYTDLTSALAQKGVQLRTTPEFFQSGHELPGWYERFKDFTPASVWCGMDEVSELPNLVATLRSGPAVVKDFVKSMKHYWHEAAFVSEVHNERALLAVVTRLLELRGDDLVGGVVVREFEDFLPGEARTWWVDGVCRLTTAHPDTPELIAVPERLDEIATSVSSLGAPFVSVDLALRTDGVWRVIEVGDGQVSDLPSSTPAEQLLEILLTR